MKSQTVSQPKQDLKSIYEKNGKYVIKNYSDGTETVLCDNKAYAKKYAETYGIPIVY